ncbi:MAG: GIY-YIG nuclease family protein [Waddliaceae bacterium]|mgnify:CR=1 FL=1|jgi:putative endonuclease|nr:GIY-YIG nuclease family protein [Waddliaceae bacterium]MBT3579162.1 GIY-YIG nuclease family protein [Waddliaceae bacterium]MBT4444318.1 GIY-YIG nuclease family protein [Waddliaceae bacterium]MBT6928533.1 GIY-YIG nuclease family protein [Waddliaceae bacterium]MBT7264871.1 GIY-YIG nuclease family protein [Waddliaceae bacterium]
MSEENEWTVYIIETVLGRLYTGITTDISRRFQEHFGSKGAKFFRSDAPKKVVFQEKHKNRSQATKRELEIKKMSKQEKNRLICHRTFSGNDVFKEGKTENDSI